jgi:hypothetical protein
MLVRKNVIRARIAEEKLRLCVDRGGEPGGAKATLRDLKWQISNGEFEIGDL